jgi:tRNA uridine 5-carbamoylmethylation protein Kti12
LKIILLSGKPNTGKTTALNMLYKKITGKEPDYLKIPKTKNFT